MEIGRDTKYSKQILSIIGSLGHATNAQLLASLRQTYPDVSATTVHRVTARLLQRNKVLEAPTDKHGSMRYDSAASLHDHFICNGCGGIRDIDIAADLLPKVSQALGGCQITGRLVIYGNCEKCLSKEKQYENNNL
ncbi:MAG: transcriptional repressor [Candidatus Saccharibacteria bacterium]